MMEVLIFSLAFGLITGLVLVARGGPENSLIGLNVATICGVTYLVLLHKSGLSFAQDIAFYLLFPGFLGIIVFSRFIEEVAR